MVGAGCPELFAAPNNKRQANTQISGIEGAPKWLKEARLLPAHKRIWAAASGREPPFLLKLSVNTSFYCSRRARSTRIVVSRIYPTAFQPKGKEAQHSSPKRWLDRSPTISWHIKDRRTRENGTNGNTKNQVPEKRINGALPPVQKSSPLAALKKH